MHRTVEAAFERGVAVGAHPSLPDLQGFGRRMMRLTPQETYQLVLYQVGALAGFCRVAGRRLSHVKAHGALYNMAAKDAVLADAIAHAVRDFDPALGAVRPRRQRTHTRRPCRRIESCERSVRRPHLPAGRHAYPAESAERHDP